MTDRTPEPQTADNLIPFRRLAPNGRPVDAQRMANMTHYVAERMEPCRATSEYLNRPCRSPAELEALLRAQAATTATIGE